MRRLVVCLVATLALLPACSSSTTRTSAPAVAATATTTLPASYRVVQANATYVDTTRPTPRNGTYPGAPTRTLRVHFWYPDSRAGAPFPLVLFSHGHNGSPEGYDALLSDVARAGYVVAAPEYPLSHQGAPGGATISDLPNQPKDASFVIDRVLAAASGPGFLHGLVDPNRIAAAGHSLGAMTTYALAFNDRARDPRVEAAVVLSGIAAGVPGAYFTGPHIPLLATHGELDRTIAYTVGRSAFQQATRPKYFVTIVGGAHSTEEKGGSTPKQRALTRAVIGFLDYYVKHEPAGLAAMRGAASQPGLTTLDAQP